MEGESRFNYREHRDERMNLIGGVIIRADFLQQTLVLECAYEYYELLLAEADKRGFYIPAP